jgi:hypothetical protein
MEVGYLGNGIMLYLLVLVTNIFLMYMNSDINTNGPAIKGGCVTRRQHRAGSWYFSRETVTVQGGYGALFAVRVQILLSITSVAVQTVTEPEICHGAGFKLLADERVRVQRSLRICLGCRSKS